MKDTLKIVLLIALLPVIVIIAPIHALFDPDILKPDDGSQE